MDSSGNIIEGWDNAPHHPEISTFPHHRHVGGEVKELEKPELERFLEEVKRRMLQD